MQALCQAYSLPRKLLQQILRPQPAKSDIEPAELAASNLPAALIKAISSKYNASQQAAVAACCSSRRQLTLVQGPPGTGKTSTVVAMISSLLLAIQPPTGPSLKQNPPATSLLRREEVAGQAAQKVRILVCAQSNAAIDELIMRLADPGIIGADGKYRIPEMVRLGKMESAHESIKAYHIDFVSGRATKEETKVATAEADAQKGFKEVAELQQQLLATRKALDEAEASQGEESAAKEQQISSGNLAALRDKRRRLALELKAVRDKAQKGNDQMSRAKKEMRQAIVRGAEIVAATLSSAGGDLMTLCKGSVGFQGLIIDEAAQALEPAAQIAFQLLAPEAKIVMVGDPQQLPATVLSKAATASNLTQSLFERFQQAKWPVVMLSEQYRMHPEISRWPAQYFYGDKLVNGALVTAGACSADFHSRACFPPLAVFDCRSGREQSGRARGGSLTNSSEADLVCTLLTGLEAAFPKAFEGSIAVLTPYKAQLGLLRSMASQRLRKRSLSHIDFATVDGFQGKEADVVIFSCVRARGPGAASSIGFLADVRRMNVALTRARRGLWVVGHSETLAKSPPWNSLLQHARSRKCLYIALPPFAGVLSANLNALTTGTYQARKES